MLKITSSGSFRNSRRFLNRVSNMNIASQLESFGREGVAALAAATPVDSGLTAASWQYKVTHSANEWSITWYNTHVVSGTPVAILLQYGHGTGTGGYVRGRDYINPAIKPIFDRIAEEVWKVVTSA